MQSTNYFFDVTPANFEEALDRFAQFFISPLFTADCAQREMKAVDSGTFFFLFCCACGCFLVC